MFYKDLAIGFLHRALRVYNALINLPVHSPLRLPYRAHNCMRVPVLCFRWERYYEGSSDSIEWRWSPALLDNTLEQGVSSTADPLTTIKLWSCEDTCHIPVSSRSTLLTSVLAVASTPLCCDVCTTVHFFNGNRCITKHILRYSHPPAAASAPVGWT